MFGYEPGAFTRANRPHPGHIEQADGGVLFLDEIGDLDLAGQAELIRRVLEQERWNKTKAAERLPWSRATLYRKIDKYGIK